MNPVFLHLSKPSRRLTVGSSRFFGYPDLPPDCPYPFHTDDEGTGRPYPFVCQINLSEMAPYDKDNMLPHVGMLSFFARIDPYLGYYAASDCIGGIISSADAVRVLYFPSCENLVETEPGDEDLLVPESLQVGFGSVQGQYDEHILFAPPVHRQWENWDPPFEDRLVLLQVDSFDGEDFDLNFMDMGVLDFLISPSALKDHDFSDVRAIVLSS